MDNLSCWRIYVGGYNFQQFKKKSWGGCNNLFFVGGEGKGRGGGLKSDD